MSDANSHRARRRAPAGWVSALAILVLAGCGGASSTSSVSHGSLTAPKGNASLQSGMIGGAQSAGRPQSYVPKGKIIADSGFRPWVDGFDFENYGNDAGPVNMTPANMVDLFGSQVCVAGSGPSCTLSPLATHWMDRVNTSMAGGHCMGFSVTALRFFTQNLSPAQYGAASTIKLPVQGNDKLQSLIAEDFAYQDLPAVTNQTVQAAPTQVLDALISALKAHKETYTLGILKADGTGGHAVTPIAVEDRGNGRNEIIVYDNNFPGILRAIDVNTQANTWHYLGGINPSNTGEIYNGDAQTKSMLLLPTSPGEKTQPCPFCAPSSTGPGATSPIDKLHYIEVAITSKAAQHPHFLFTDPQGRQTGFVNGKLVAQIPGIQVIQNYSVQNWSSAPEPTYHLPIGHPDYQVTVDGSNLTRSVVTQLQVNGAGLVFYVQKIRMVPGQKDTMALPAKDLGISYASESRFAGSPTVLVAFPSLDPLAKVANNKVVELLAMGVGSVGFAPGSPIALAINPSAGAAVIGSQGDKPLVSGAHFVLYVDNAPVNGTLPEKKYFTATLPLKADQAAEFRYLHLTGTALPVSIIDLSGKPLGSFQVPQAH